MHTYIYVCTWQHCKIEFQHVQGLHRRLKSWIELTIAISIRHLAGGRFPFFWAVTRKNGKQRGTATGFTVPDDHRRRRGAREHFLGQVSLARRLSCCQQTSVEISCKRDMIWYVLRINRYLCGSSYVEVRVFYWKFFGEVKYFLRKSFSRKIS